MRPVSPTLVLLLALGALPLVTASPYHLTVAGLALIFAILAQGANLIIGTAGQASFAHAAFFGLGAYTTAILTAKFGFPVWTTLPLALGLAYGVGSLLAYPALRVKGFYLALVTLAFSEIFTSLVSEIPGVLGGTEGVSGIPSFSLGRWSADGRTGKFYIVWIAAVVACISLERLHASHFGRVARSLRDSETGATAVGINLTAAKVRVFAVSATYMGLAGFLYAHFMQYIGPASFGLNVTILVLSMVVVGGIGDTLGVLVGALALSLLPQLTRDYVGLEPVIYGGLLVGIILLLPQGMIPALRAAWHRSRRSGAAS